MHKLFRSSLEAPHNQELCGSHVSDVRFLTRVWWRSATWRAASVTPPARLAITDHPRGLDADPTCLPLLLNYTPAVPSKRTVPPRSHLACGTPQHSLCNHRKLNEKTRHFATTSTTASGRDFDYPKCETARAATQFLRHRTPADQELSR